MIRRAHPGLARSTGLFLEMRRASTGLVLLTIVTLGGCASDGTPNVIDPGDGLVLGAVYCSSGAQARLDQPSRRGAQLAVDQANANGGVWGVPIELVVEGGASTQAEVGAAVQTLMQEPRPPAAYFGLSDTDLVLAAAPTAAMSGRLFLTSGATSPLLPQQVPGELFLACFGDNVQAAAAAEWIVRERGGRSVAVLYDATHAYTNLLRGYATEALRSRGADVVAETGFTPGTAAAAARTLPPADVVFLAAQNAPDMVAAITMLRGRGFTGPIVGGDAFDDPATWRAHPDLDGIYYTTHAYLGADAPSPRTQAFRTAYRSAYPDAELDAFAALGYDAANLLIDAARRGGSADAGTMTNALAGTRDFVGVTGSISYAGGSRIPRKSVWILGVRDGRTRLVQEILPDSVPAP